MFIVAVVDDLKQRLDIFDEHQLRDRSNELESKLCLRQVIEFHVQAKQLSALLNAFYRISRIPG